MATRIGGSKRKARNKLRKNLRCRGKLSLRRYFQELNNGEKVALNTESSLSNGMYHLRHHGKIGTIVGKKGTCYQVQIKDINKVKVLIVHPVHLKKL